MMPGTMPGFPGTQMPPPSHPASPLYRNSVYDTNLPKPIVPMVELRSTVMLPQDSYRRWNLDPLTGRRF